MTLPCLRSARTARLRTPLRPLAGVILLGIFAAACGTATPEQPAASTTTTAAAAQTFTQSDNGKEALLAVGEEVVVSLETCGGCGYEWRITAPADTTVIEPLGSSNQPRPTSTQPGEAPIVGAPTDTNFRFRGAGTGRTEVTIGHFPPAGQAPEESFTIAFVVA